MRLFKRKSKVERPVPTEPTQYPSGVCVETESGKYYLKGNRKYKIYSEAVFKSWKFPVVLKSSDAAISKYTPSLRRLGFRDGTIVRDIYDATLYIISDSKRIPITSVEMFNLLELDDVDIPFVSHEDVIFHMKGGSE